MEKRKDIMKVCIGHYRRRHNTQSATNWHAGMTLIELMVALSILAGVIVIVNSMIINAKHAIVSAQDVLVVNADARAVIARLRADLASITREGFLAICNDPDDGQHLVFTAVGPFASMVDSSTANSARIDYGRTTDSEQILWRRAVLLDPTNNSQNDHEQITLADYKGWTRTEIDFALYNNSGGYSCSGMNFPCFINPLENIVIPPITLEDVNNLWPYLASPCTELKFEWTDGSLTDGKITWYGPDNPQDSNWDSHSPDDNTIEYANDAGKYCALWTWENKDNWPKALRITFTLGNKNLTRFYTYETIVYLP